MSQLGCCLEYASSSESNGQVERAHSTIIEIYNSNKHKFQNLGVKSRIELAVALYNELIHSSTKLKPIEIIFNLNNSRNSEEIIAKAHEMFEKAKTNMLNAQEKLLKKNPTRENPPTIQEQQEVFVIPNTRNKTEARANPTIASRVKEKTFVNSNNVKRHKNKIKR